MAMTSRPGSIWLVMLLCVFLGGGCATGRPKPAADPSAGTSRFVIAAPDYARAFETARVELLRLRYEIDRADAQAGVIQTLPTTGAGLLAPWTIGPGTRLAEDTLNAQGRLVEVRFEPAELLDQPPQGRAALSDADMPVGPLRATGPIVVSVRVLVLRRVTPTRRLEPSAIRLSSNPIKPELFQRGLAGQFHAPTDLDANAARALAGSIERRLLERAGGRDADGGAPDQGGPGVSAQLPVQ